MFLVVAAAIAFAWVCGRLVRGIGQPPVIGELLAGIVIGPSVLGALAPEASARLFTPETVVLISRLAQAAILVFMFLVGLELDRGILRRHARGVLRIASFSLAVPFVLGVWLATKLYPSFHGDVAQRLPFLLFVGTAMSITAMPVLTRILTDLRMLQTPIGTIALGCAAIDDVAAWTMLAFVAGLVRGQGTIGVTLALSAGYFVMMVIVIRPALAWLLVVRARPGGRIGWVLIVAAVAALSALAAEWIGIHAVFGAFLAGVCMPREPGMLEGLERPLRSVSQVLLPAFFVLIGLRTAISSVAPADWGATAAIIACASVGKIGGSFAAARTLGFSWRDAFAIGALLNTRGLVALVALDIGRTLGILSPTLFTMFVIMTFVTTLATVPLLKGDGGVFHRFAGNGDGGRLGG